MQMFNKLFIISNLLVSLIPKELPVFFLLYLSISCCIRASTLELILLALASNSESFFQVVRYIHSSCIIKGGKWESKLLYLL